ncbi:hypothetical protein ACSUZJ_04115 [Telluria sp. B2]
MNAAIAVRIPSEAEARSLDPAGQERSSFILQVHRPMSPSLLEQLHEVLATLDSETNLVPVEPVMEFIDLDEPAGREDPVPAHVRANRAAMREASLRGEAQLRKWSEDGTLVEGRRIQDAWGITRQALDKARERGEIFSFRIGGQHFYPAEALHLTREHLARIIEALGPASAASKLIFLRRQHGSLGAATPAEAIEKGRLADVLRLAQAWTQS